MTASIKFSFLPTLPLDPAWIEQSAAFLHADPRMAKAGMKLLFAAWRGQPVASIPASHAYVAEITGLPLEVVAERYVALTDGFELREDGRLHHIHLAHVCAKMAEAYGKEIEAYVTAAAMVAQDPEQFSLMSMEAVGTKKPRGKTLMPKGFGYDMFPALREWAGKNGCPAPNQQAWLMERFIDYCNGRSEKFKDWEAGFRTWASNEMGKFRHSPPPPVWGSEGPPAGFESIPPVAPRTGFGNSGAFSGLARRSRGEVALDHNSAVLAQAQRVLSERRGG